MFLHQAIEGRFFGTPLLVLDRVSGDGTLERWEHE
jgi:hypothetical protein